MDTDEFGIRKLHQTAGREWVSNWHRTGPRTVCGVRWDPGDDCHTQVRGVDPVVEFLGTGVARMSGPDPRIYVHDRGGVETWGTVEVTVYARRVTEDEPDNHQGFIVGARSEHQDAGSDPARGTAYYGRVMYANGNANFIKVLGHPCYTDRRGRQVRAGSAVSRAPCGWG